jgi:hypothetical protein
VNLAFQHEQGRYDLSGVHRKRLAIIPNYIDLGNHQYKELVKQQNYDEVEKIFWKNVENTESEEVKVEYAADLPATTFGTENMNEETKSYAKHPWNLNKMHLKNNSMLQF